MAKREDSLRQRALQAGLSVGTVYSRKKLNWSDDQALSTPAKSGLSPELVKMALDRGMKPSTLRQRLHLGWDLNRALDIPAHDRELLKKYSYKGKMLSAAELENISGIPRVHLSHRINTLGWSVEKAMTTPVKRRAAREVRKYIPGWFRLYFRTKLGYKVGAPDSYKAHPICETCLGEMGVVEESGSLFFHCEACGKKTLVDEVTIRGLKYKVG